MVGVKPFWLNELEPAAVPSAPTAFAITSSPHSSVSECRRVQPLSTASPKIS